MTSLATPRDPYPQDWATWVNHVRPRVMHAFAEQVYGVPPASEHTITWRTLDEWTTDHGDLRRELAMSVHGERGSATLTVLVHLPAGRTAAPAFVGLNFRGNHATTTDPRVINIAESEHPDAGRIHYRGSEDPPVPPERGSHARRWPYELISSRGYAVVTVSHLQTGPDHWSFFDHGVHPVMEDTDADERVAGRWGAISVWAWTLRRILDGIVDGHVAGVDPTRVVAVGHSRLGKTALWAAAQDPRFAAVISNDSGCMGAALSRPIGETPEVLARVRPYWFARRFSDLVLAGEPLPVDQHQLLACVAPRPLYVASASEDANADPQGEFASLVQASRMWQLYGHRSITATFPGPGESLDHDGPLGHHLRQGGHDILAHDWARFLDFADRVLD